MEKCSASLTIQEMQIKTTLRFPPHLLEWIPSRTQTTTNVSEGVEKNEP
jgi:hypothetical protein